MAKQAERVNVEIYLEDVRISHPHLFEAQQYKKDKNSKPRFTAGFILDKKKHRKAIEEIEDAIDKIREEMFDGRKIKADNICLSDGDDSDKDEFQGAMVLRAASPENKPPEVLGRDKRPLSKRDGKPYGGCYVNAIVRIYGYDAYADQVNCSLEAVQYFRKGPSFGAGPADTSKFGTYDSEDDEEFTSMRDRKSRGRDDDEDEKPRSRRNRDEDEDEKPARRSRSRDDDDDDDRPRSRRSRDEDDEDDAPKSRRSRSRDDDDDDAPRSRRRSRDDD